MSRPGLQPPNLVLKWVKRVEDDVDHSLASSAKVKNEWTYSSTPLTHLQGANRDIVFIFLTYVLFLFTSTYSSAFFLVLHTCYCKLTVPDLRCTYRAND